MNVLDIIVHNYNCTVKLISLECVVLLAKHFEVFIFPLTWNLKYISVKIFLLWKHCVLNIFVTVKDFSSNTSKCLKCHSSLLVGNKITQKIMASTVNCICFPVRASGLLADTLGRSVILEALRFFFPKNSVWLVVLSGKQTLMFLLCMIFGNLILPETFSGRLCKYD